MEPILPLVAVSDDAQLEPRAVEKDKVHHRDRVHLLDVVAQLNVLGYGRVKVDNPRSLVAVALEEDVLLRFPDHLVAA